MVRWLGLVHLRNSGPQFLFFFAMCVNAGHFLHDGPGARQNSEQPQQISQCLQTKVREAVRSVYYSDFYRMTLC